MDSVCSRIISSRHTSRDCEICSDGRRISFRSSCAPMLLDSCPTHTEHGTHHIFLKTQHVLPLTYTPPPLLLLLLFKEQSCGPRFHASLQTNLPWLVRFLSNLLLLLATSMHRKSFVPLHHMKSRRLSLSPLSSIPFVGDSLDLLTMWFVILLLLWLVMILFLLFVLLFFTLFFLLLCFSLSPGFLLSLHLIPHLVINLSNWSRPHVLPTGATSPLFLSRASP